MLILWQVTSSLRPNDLLISRPTIYNPRWGVSLHSNRDNPHWPRLFLSFDIEPAIECDDEYWEIAPGTGVLSFHQPPNKPSYIIFFNQQMKIMEIIAFVLRTLYSIRKSKDMQGLSGQEWAQQIVSDLDSALNKWADSVPDHRTFPVLVALSYWYLFQFDGTQNAKTQFIYFIQRHCFRSTTWLRSRHIDRSSTQTLLPLHSPLSQYVPMPRDAVAISSIDNTVLWAATILTQWCVWPISSSFLPDHF